MNRNIRGKNKVYLAFANEEEASYEFSLLYDDGDIDKTLILCRGSDFGIIAEVYDISNQPSLEFEVSNKNLFYQPLINFLQDESEIIIDDEESLEEYDKKVTIKKNGDNIKLIFSYAKIDKFGAFSVHIKNTQQDPRSTIDKTGKNTKGKLHILFNELYSVFEQYKDEDVIDEDAIEKPRGLVKQD